MSKSKDFLFPLIAFALPLSKAIVPILIALVLLFWILEADFRNKFASLKSKSFLQQIALYIFLLVGLSYTENTAAGGFDMEQKMSLLLFPLLLFTSIKLDDEKQMQIERNFVFGCLLSIILCLVNASIHYYNSYSLDSFFYASFSCIMHPSYYGMYLCMACVFVLFRKDLLFKTFYKIPASLFLSLGVVLASSKSALLTLLLVFTAKVFHKIIVKRDYKSSIVILGSLLIVLCSMFVIFPKSISRLSDMTQTLQSHTSELNTTSSRIVIWKHSVEKILQKPLFGYGTGDVNDVLQESYQEKNESHIKELKLNAHNQYLQTTLALGLVGLLALVFPYFTLAIIAMKSKDFIIAGFVLVVCFNLLFEAMYETQAGIVFIAFFLSLFLKKSKA